VVAQALAQVAAPTGSGLPPEATNIGQLSAAQAIASSFVLKGERRCPITFLVRRDMMVDEKAFLISPIIIMGGVNIVNNSRVRGFSLIKETRARASAGRDKDLPTIVGLRACA